MDMLFPKSWLDERDPDDPQGRTNREVQIEVRSHSLLPSQKPHRRYRL